MSMVYHYTSETQHLPLILESGHLEPSNAGAPDESPLLWFSRSHIWEATATKMIMTEAGLKLLTREQQLELFGCVRFILPADDRRLLEWKEACQLAGTPRIKRRRMEKTGKKLGASPSDWLAMPCIVPLSEVNLERFNGETWEAMQ